MTDKSSAGAGSSRSTVRPPSFVTGWIDRLGAWVDRWPGPNWLYYLGLWLVLFLIQSVVPWVEGAAAPGTFLTVHAYHAGAVALLLFIIHILNESAGKALQTLKPVWKSDEQEFQDLHFRLTHLPAGGAVLSGLMALLVLFILEGISGTFQVEILHASPISAGLFRLVYLMAWWVYGFFLYHTIQQLRLIHRIYTRHTHVNLFHIKPLYAFSNLSALTAVSLTVVPYGWMAVNPDVTFSEPSTVIVYLLITSMAIVTFVWPQWGLHRLQLAEKGRLIDEANRRFEITIRDLHDEVDRGEFDKIANLNVTLTSLNLELSVLRKIPTWPWQPETVRWLITALVLPLGLWLLQYLLQRMLGG